MQLLSRARADETLASQSPSQTSSDLSLSTLTAVVATVVGATSVIIAIVFFLRGSTGAYNVVVTSESLVLRAKTWDHVMFLVAVVATAALVFSFIRDRAKRPVWMTVAAICATGGLVVGVFSVEEPEIAKYGYLWSGFGIGALVLIVVISPLLWRVFEWRSLPKSVRIVLTCGFSALCVSDALVLYRPIYALIDPLNDIYMLNEMLAPVAGHAPDAQFVPLYTTLYGWLLKPFGGASVGALTTAACVIFSVMSILAVFLGCVLAYRVLDRRSFALAAMFVVPLACVQVGHYAYSTVAAEYQDYPIRLFPVMLLAFFAIEDLVRIRRGIVRPWRLFAVGFLAGLVAWNNHDFGITGVFVFALLFAVSGHRRFSGWRAPGFWFLGLFAGVAIYPVALAIAGTPVSLSDLFHFEEAFARGFYAYPAQIPGPVMVVMPFILAAAGVGWYTLWTRQRDPDRRIHLDEFTERASLTATFFGTWMVVAFFYYLNRSIAAGQLQVYLPPAGVAIASLVALCLRPMAQAQRPRFWPRRADFSRAHLERSPWWQTRLCLVPVTLLSGIPFAAILQSPYPSRVLAELRSPVAWTTFAWPSVGGIFAEAAAARNAHQSIVYFGEWGNYVQLSTGVRSVALVDDPPAGPPVANGPECDYVNSAKAQVLLTDSTTAQAFGDARICGDYVATSDQLASPYLIYRRTVVNAISSTSLLDQAIDDQRAGNYNAAAYDYLEVLKVDPSNEYAGFGLGALYQIDDKDCPAATNAYDKVLAAHPKYVPALFNLAICESSVSLSSAISLYQEVLTLSPKDALAYHDLGVAQEALGELAQGRANIATGTRLDPSLGR